jgi:TnpA family transposase
VNHAFYNTLR